MPRQHAGTWYFNSGTWARLIKLEPEVRQDLERFKRVFDIFKGGTFKAVAGISFEAMSRAMINHAIAMRASMRSGRWLSASFRISRSRVKSWSPKSSHSG